MQTKVLLKRFAFSVVGIILFSIYILTFTDELRAAEDNCSPGSYCLQIKNVTFSEKADTIYISVNVACPKWRGRAYNLRINLKAFDSNGICIKQNHKLTDLAEGEEGVKLLKLEDTSEGTYIFNIEVFDMMNSNVGDKIGVSYEKLL